MSPLSERALERALGQSEKLPNGEVIAQERPLGSNWGHPVQDFLASVNLFQPAAWCMAFMYWCFKDAANQLGLPCPLKKSGQVLLQWHNAPAENKIPISPTADQPQPGDIFIMDLGHGLGHTGIIHSINEDGSLNTVEGNTNDTGSREGIAVVFKTGEHARKNGKPIIGYLRF